MDGVVGVQVVTAVGVVRVVRGSRCSDWLGHQDSGWSG